MIELYSPDLNLAKIADSGQCFRLNRLEDGHFLLTACQQVLLLDELPGGARLHCTQVQYDRLWRTYFDMDTDYKAFRAAVLQTDTFLTRAVAYGAGIRILRQEPWETLVTFIISQRKSIPAIRCSVELLCQLAGERLADGAAYAFPSPQAIASLSLDELCSCKLGYRAPYVQETARCISRGQPSLQELASLPTDALLAALQQLPGVGPKVANCTALFGFHRLEGFPRDVWINRILAREYCGVFCTEPYQGFEGVIQQYMFYYARSAEYAAQCR